MNSLVRADNLFASRGGRVVLRNVSLDVPPGRVTLIIGANGAGKTTLLRLLAGAAKPQGGTIQRSPKLTVGYIPQRFPHHRAAAMRVRDFLNLPKPAPLQSLQDALLLTNSLNLLDAQITSLSGGEIQRVLLARALLHKPQLLALDEPTASMDHRAAASFAQLIKRLAHEQGVGVVAASHDLQLVTAHADAVVCLHDGVVMCSGEPHAIADNPAYLSLFGDDARDLAVFRHQPHRP